MKQVTARKRVLVIAFDFPPRRTSAVYRNTHLTKYLVQFGWQPTVLTVTTKLGGVEEPELLECLPSEVRIERTRYLPVSGWEDSTAKAIRTAGALQSRYDETKQPLLDRWVRSAGDLVRSCLYFPDDTVGWVPFGLARAARLIREERYEVVYTMSPPRSATVLGLLLKLFFGIPWVLEFQDPWYPPNRPWRRRFEHWLQAFMLRKANAVVVMTEQHKEDFHQSFHVPLQKLAVVRNGFDEEDFNFCTPPDKDLFPPGYIHLSHFGTVYSDSTGQFFAALSEFVREYQDVRRRLRINIIGYPDKAILAYANDGELREVIKLYPFVPHHKALQAMRASHCLLLFWGRRDFSRLAVAGKTYEYLRIGRPILAVTYEGGVKELVEGAGAGWVVQPEDTEAMKEVLKSVLNEGATNAPLGPRHPEFVEQFRWDRLAEKLASVFDSVSSHGA